MLLEFCCKNYKTFRDEAAFSLIPYLRLRDLPYSILKEKVQQKEYKALSCAVIYGPNASGKTNLIEAMDLFRCIVESGDILDRPGRFNPNPVASNLSVVPNINASKNEPVVFSISFITDNKLVDYELGLKLGAFMDRSFSRQVAFEKLYLNDDLIFDRAEAKINKINFSVSDLFNKNSTRAEIIKRKAKEMEGMKEIVQKNLAPEDLFLTNGFKSSINRPLAETVINWITQSFSTFHSSQYMSTFPGVPLEERQIVFPRAEIIKALQEFGVNHNRIGYAKLQEGKGPRKMSKIEVDKKSYLLPADMFESQGTLRFLDLIPVLFEAFRKGETVVIDEFDASLHPMALMSIIKAFHNDEINLNGAQLVFNTHNPIFLRSDLFRRDEIKFVDRDKQTGDSELYQLSDFKTNSSEPVRNTSAYMKNYFVHRYGAIEDIDFSELFQVAAKPAKEPLLVKDIEACSATKSRRKKKPEEPISE